MTPTPLLCGKELFVGPTSGVKQQGKIQFSCLIIFLRFVHGLGTSKFKTKAFVLELNIRLQQKETISENRGD